MDVRRQLWFDAAVLLAATVATVSAVAGVALNPLGVVSGLVLSLFASGYALLRALFPNGLSTAERFALSVPVSFGLGVLDGVVVNQTPLGLAAVPMVLTLWASTVVCAAIGYYRLQRLASDVPDVSALPQHRQFRPPFAQLAIAASLLVVAGGWAAFSLVAASRAEPKTFTALSVDGANATPAAGQPLTVTLENQEGRPMQYDLEVNLAGTVVSRLDGVRVDPGRQYSFTLPALPAQGAGADVLAYRSGDSQPYRRIHVGGAGPAQ
jgi:uncharacterized membrane protein